MNDVTEIAKPAGAGSVSFVAQMAAAAAAKKAVPVVLDTAKETAVDTAASTAAEDYLAAYRAHTSIPGANTAAAQDDYFSLKHDDLVGVRFFHSTSGGSANIPLPDGNMLPFTDGVLSTADPVVLEIVLDTIRHCGGLIREISYREALSIVAGNIALMKPFKSFARGTANSAQSRGVKQGNYMEAVAQATGNRISESTKAGLDQMANVAETGIKPA